MMIEWLVACLYLVSILSLLLSLKYSISVFTISWFLPFKLTRLFISFFISLIFFISAQQLSKFFISDRGTQIAEIQIQSLEKQTYLVNVEYSEHFNYKNSFEVHGDFWQLDLSLITFNTFLASLGLDCLYRIERLGGRYQLIDDEIYAKRSIYQFSEKKVSDELWFYIRSHMPAGIFRAIYGAALYAPMKDQASYGVFLTATGAEVLPLNDVAKQALSAWQ